MKFYIYAIKDNAKGSYLQPFFVPFFQKKEDVIVDFGRNLNAAQSVLTQVPEDFDLFCIGEFYDETGVFNPLTPELVCKCVDLIKEKKEDVGNTEIN